MAYDNPFEDQNGLTDPNNPGGAYPPPAVGPGAEQPPPAAAPKTGYDLEAFRKRWMQSGNVNDPMAWLRSNQDITGGVTLKNEKAYDPTGRFIADLVGNYSGAPVSDRSRIFLDGIGSNGKPRSSTKKVMTSSVPSVPKTTSATNSSSSSSSSQSIAPIRDPRLDELYNTLLGRSQQGLAVNRMDPVIRAQADAYSANEERARRNDLANLAEKSGPNANLRVEERLGAERVGQRTGSFEAELMSREITARRDEIQNALTSMGNLLTTEQTLALQKELAKLDDATRRLSIGNQDKQYYAGLNQQDKQFGQDLGYRNKALDQSDNQFRDQLGFNYADRSNYWDSIYRGIV